MKIPRDLSGQQLVQALCRDWGYFLIHQEGSHMVIETEEPSHQRLSIPNHNPLRVGLLAAILRDVVNHKRVERQEILDSL
jgi:predicted RNA binding protein YcfA (HicA-like mRNA interferase family)